LASSPGFEGLSEENDVLGNVAGLTALDAALTRSTDTLLKRKNKKRLIIDLDSTEVPARGRQEGLAENMSTI
jgi:hypothetical protein